VCALQLVQRGDSTVVDVARGGCQRFFQYSDTKQDKLLALYNLALLEIELENWAAANEAAESHIELDPLNPDGYALKARAMVNMGQAQDAELFIVLTNCLRAEPEADVGAWCEGASAAYGAASELAAYLGANGCPDSVYVHTDSSGKDMVILVYTSAGKALAYYDGEHKGDREITVENP
jgi:hypothetical protein